MMGLDQMLKRQVNDSLNKETIVYDATNKKLIFPELLTAHSLSDLLIQNVTGIDTSLLRDFLNNIQDLQKNDLLEMAIDHNDSNTKISARNIGIIEGRKLVLLQISNEADHQAHIQSEELETRYNEFIDHASHDLQSPLRKLGVFVDKLVSEQTGVNRVDLTKRIRLQIQKMRSIIDSMTELARSNTLEFVHCDLNDIAKDVINEFSEELGERHFTIELASLPVIEADEQQMRILFLNLIDNAIKFSNPSRNSYLRISSREKNSNQGRKVYEISFEDNGIGFSPDFTEKIFEPFKRMHTNADIPGNGLGLTICKRIALNHGGTIIADSDATSGARFVLILPDRRLK